MKFQILILSLLPGVLAVMKYECSNVFAYHVAPFSPKCHSNPDILSNVTSTVERHGYRVDTFQVTTNDGYILKVYRMYSQTSPPTRYPVLVLHGLGVTTGIWVHTGNRALAFNLVEAGYDVWLGTFRGTDEASHVTMSKKDPSYWNYWMDPLAEEDLDKQVIFVAEQTNQKILVLSHSLSTTIAFMYASEFSEKANRLIRGIIAVSPMAYVHDILPLQPVSWFGIPLLEFLDFVHFRAILYPEKILQKLAVTACKTFPEFCFLILSTATGPTKQFAPEDMLLFLSYFPSGVALKIWQQNLQFVRSRKFQKFDFGKVGNLKHYGTPKPPIYNISNIQVPMYLMYGLNDIVHSKKGVDRFFTELGSTKKNMTAIPINADKKYNFCHMDFLNSRNIVKFFYEPLLDIMLTFFI